jgi:hypothetical protein
VSLSRRTMLARGLQGAVGASLATGFRARFALAQSASNTRLPDGFSILSLGAMNVLAVSDASGVALVDGAPAGRAAELAGLVAALPQAGKVHTLFNTHWHPEHTGSNESLGQAGATIVAQENTKQWLTTDVTWPWSDETVEPLAKAGLPNKTFYEETELQVGGRTVRCGRAGRRSIGGRVAGSAAWSAASTCCFTLPTTTPKWFRRADRC